MRYHIGQTDPNITYDRSTLIQFKLEAIQKTISVAISLCYLPEKQTSRRKLNPNEHPAHPLSNHSVE
jgi:hypothetical protein